MGNRSNINLVGNTTQGQNVGGGDACVFKCKPTGNVLQFRSISATGDSIQIFQTDNEILISGATGGGTGGTTYTFTNGLTESGGNACLGGTLSTNTTINANANSLVVCSASSINMITDFGGCLHLHSVGFSFNILSLTNGGSLPSYLLLANPALAALGAHTSYVRINGTQVPLDGYPALSVGMCVSGSSACNAGLLICGSDNPSVFKSAYSQPINYAGDYTAKFSDNSLVTKKWVLENATGGTGGSGFTIACNGLSGAGTTVCLGGILTQSTTISGSDSNILRLEAVGDYSSSADEITPYLEFFGDSAITLRIDTDRSGDNYETGLQIDDFGGAQEVKLILGNETGSSLISLSSCETCGLLLHSTNGIYLSGTTYLETPPPTGACTDVALTWSSGTTGIRQLPIVEEWVNSPSNLEYVGQKYSYPTHSVFVSDVATCVNIPNYKFVQNIDLKSLGTTLVYNIPTGMKIFLNCAKLVMLNSVTPSTGFAVSIGNNQSNYNNLAAQYCIDDALENDVYSIPICACAVGINTGGLCCAQVYFNISTAAQSGGNVCAHLFLDGFLY